MKDTFKIYTKPTGLNLTDETSLFDIRALGAFGAVKFFLSTNKYKKVQIISNDKNGCLFFNMLYCFMLLNICSKVTDVNSVKIGYFSRMTSLIRLVVSSSKLMRLSGKVNKLILEYPAKYNKGEIDYSRVLYLKTNLSFGVKAGGSIGHISGVVNALNEKFEVSYVSAEEPIMIDSAVDIVDVSLDRFSFSFPYELNSLSLNAAYLDASVKYMEKSKPSVIYQRLTLFNYVGAELSNRFNIPLVVEYNGSEVWVQKSWGKGINNSELALQIEQYMLETASKVITVSKVLVDELIDRGIDKEKIVYYPNCIDPKVYNNDVYTINDVKNVRKDIGILENDFVFTFIGTFGKWHGIEFLANAIKKFIDDDESFVREKNIKFLLIGDGLLFEKIKTTLSDKKYENYIKFTGIIAQKEAPRFLNASNAFLSPHIKQKQRFIGSPTKLFEYMAFSKPIIASDLEQIGEVLNSSVRFPDSTSLENLNRSRAILFEPNNTEALIEAIKFTAENTEVCEVLGLNAKEEVMKSYTWDIHVKQLWN